MKSQKSQFPDAETSPEQIIRLVTSCCLFTLYKNITPNLVLKISYNSTQEALGSHRSPEKPVKINEFI